MLKIIIFTLLFFISLNLFAEKKFELTPLVIDFYGGQVKGDTIIAFGDCGSMLITYNNGQNWIQSQAFDKGVIFNVFIEDDRYVAFNELGSAALSTDKGKSWKSVLKSKDSVRTVIADDNHYIIRTANELLLLDKSFIVKNSYQLDSPFLWEDNYIDFKYKWSVVKFKNYIVLQCKKECIVFDEQLNYLRSFNFNLFPHYQLYASNNYLYIRAEGIIKLKDFDSVEYIYNKPVFLSGVFNDSVYIFKSELYWSFKNPFECHLIKDSASASFIKLSKKTISRDIKMKDFIINNNRVIIVGNRKYISINNLNDSILNEKSNLTGFSLSCLPQFINDSTYLLHYDFNYGNGRNDVYVNKLNDVVSKALFYINDQNYQDYPYLGFRSFHNNCIYLGLGKTYGDKKNRIYKYNVKDNILEYKDFAYYFKFGEQTWDYLWPQKCNPQKWNNNLLIPITPFYASIGELDNNLDVVRIFKFDSLNFDYFYRFDTASFIMHCYDHKEKKVSLRFTTDSGSSWNIIKRYTEMDTLLFLKEFDFANKKYLALFYRTADSNLYVEALDLDTKSLNKLYSNKFIPEKDLRNYTIFNVALTHDSSFVYLAIEDTVFVIDDLYNRLSWKFFNLPNKGKIKSTFGKYGDNFFVRYSDTVRAENVYWLKIKEIEKPEIYTEDFSYGKNNINPLNSYTAKLAIENRSDKSDLLITGFSGLTSPVFSADLPSADLANPIIIKPLEHIFVEFAFNPKEIGVFSDSLTISSNADRGDSIIYLSGEGIDTATSVIETGPNYLYNFPPYPNPANTMLQSEIYWDTSLDIDNADISVYNVLGEKVQGKEYVTIDKKTAYNGVLTWNCSTVEPAVYFIIIKHGASGRCIKAAVGR